MSATTGLYVGAVEPLKQKGSGITAAWLAAELNLARKQAQNCIIYLARKHVIERESCGRYRMVAA